MNNHGKPSIMIGNCCLTNHFNTQTCFGEALLRKGDLSGAVAYIGAINSTFWDDDFFWSVGFRNSISPAMHQNDATYEAEHLGMYDRLFHIGGEPFDEHYTSMGSMIHAGNMAVDEDGLDDYTLYYWEIYCLMGDPSLMPWLGTAQPLSLNYAQPVSRESGVVVVSTAPHAYVALRSNIDGSLIDAAYADANGNAALSFLSATADSVLLLSAICQGHIPAFGTVSLSNDANIRLGISNLQTFNVRAGQTANISFTLSNIGTDTLRYINYLLRADPAMLTPLHNDEYIDRLDPYTSISQEHVCPIAIASNLADGDIIPATLQFISDTIVTTIALQLHVQAPALSVKSIATQGIIAAGETIDLYATIINRGHADAPQFSCTIDQDYGLATILSGAQQVERLQQDSTITLHFTLLLDSLCQYLNNLPLTITAHFATHSVDLPLSLTFFADDFETSDFQTLPWQNDASFPWIISNSTARHGTHSARSPRNMPHQQASTLAISFVSHNPTDSITFDYRTATESDNDFFSVMLDTASILRTSGVATDWQTFSYPVDSGQHVLRFIYTKDHSRSVDSDCVWIDGLLLPDTLTARFTYLSDSICLGTDYAFFDTAIPTATAGTYTYSHRIADTTHLLRLAILPAPDVRIISSDTAALPGQSVILTATGATYYIWNTGDTTATITATPDTPTTYTVSGTRLGCTAQDTIRISTRPLSIATASTASITIYPNPTHGLITIQAPQMQRLTLFDIYGHSLISTTPKSPTTTIDLSPLPQGIYLLRLQSTNSITSHRIIKQ